MIKNYMADVAKMLGVELGEEFNLVDKDGKPITYNPFRIEEGGFIDCTGNDDAWFLAELLIGDFAIIKKPWVPKEGDVYYHINVTGDVFVTTFSRYNNQDSMRMRMGNCFRTKEEAEKNKGEWLDHLKQPPDFLWRIDG